MAEGVSLTSGELEVVLIKKVGLLMRPDILAMQIDGEVWGRLPMSFRIEPAAVEVIR